MAGAASRTPHGTGTRGPHDARAGAAGSGLRALVVDDEARAREELCWLLGLDGRIAQVRTASSGPEALRALQGGDIDVVFSDIAMPGLDGRGLARVIARFSRRPQVVFVTAHDRQEVDAFAVKATDYVRKPVRADRLAEAVRRVVAAADRRHGGSAVPAGPVGPAAPMAPGMPEAPVAPAAPEVPEDETIPVELGGVTRLIRRSRIRYAEAQGDYARLHTDTGSHLVRVSLNALEARWAAAGFVRIHRSTLVALPYVRQVRIERGRCTVVLDDVELQVSRRHTRGLRDRLLGAVL